INGDNTKNNEKNPTHRASCENDVSRYRACNRRNSQYKNMPNAMTPSSPCSARIFWMMPCASIASPNSISKYNTSLSMGIKEPTPLPMSGCAFQKNKAISVSANRAAFEPVTMALVKTKYKKYAINGDETRMKVMTARYIF